MHDRVEVQVEHAALGQPGREHDAVQGGQERALSAMVEPVGVLGQRTLLRQGGQPGEQGGTRVGGQILDVGDPPGGGELERQERKDRADRRDLAGAGVARLADQAGQVEGDQVGDGQQQPGHPCLAASRQLGEVEHLGAWQLLTPDRSTLVLGPPPDAGQPLFGDDLRHAGAVQRGALGGQRCRDLINRMPGQPQLDHPGSGGVLGRRPLGPWPPLGEQVQLARTEVADQRLQPGRV